MKVYNALTALIRAALWGTDPSEALAVLSEGDWQDLLRHAQRQAVVGIAYDGLSESHPGASGNHVKLPMALFAEWTSLVREIEISGSRIRAVCEKQAEVWERHGIAPYILKGTVCAAYYPKPSHRQMGDIDWCFSDPGEWEKGLEIVRSNGLDIKLDSDGDISYTLAGVVVEHHRKGLPARSDAGLICSLTDHIFHHFSTSGIGLRQLCDLALVIARTDVDKTELLSLLKKEGLEKFYGLVVAFLKEDLGLDVAEDAAVGIPGRDVSRFREIVWKDGNFGLDKAYRFSDMSPRIRICFKYAFFAFFQRWIGLFVGRIKRLRLQ